MQHVILRGHRAAAAALELREHRRVGRGGRRTRAAAAKDPAERAGSLAARRVRALERRAERVYLQPAVGLARPLQRGIGDVVRPRRRQLGGRGRHESLEREDDVAERLELRVVVE
eukprot:3794711-Prymnesium_polylepis.1